MLSWGWENLYTNLSNLSALYKDYLSDINYGLVFIFWLKKIILVLGPFQGKIACVRIPFNKGYVDIAIQLKNLLMFLMSVNLSLIACDSATNGELVIPVIQMIKSSDSSGYWFYFFDRFSPEEKFQA